MNFSSEADLEGLPCNLEAEQSVLGAVLLNPNKLVEVFSLISKDSFYNSENRQIFVILTNLFLEGAKIDFITVLDSVVSNKVFNTPDDAKLYLAHLMDVVPSISSLDVYCNIIKNKQILRNLILAAKKIESLAIQAEGEVDQIVDLAEKEICEIRQGETGKSLRPINEVIAQELNHLENVVHGNAVVSISSGYSSLDKVVTGLNPSDLIVLAARPAMGKTSFALNIATRVAKHSNKTVVIFSLEMSSQQLVERMLSSECSILSTKLHLGLLENDDWSLLAAGAQELAKCKIFMDDTPNPTIAEMKAKLRRFSDLGLVIIDYLQLMSTGKRDGNRVQEVSEITRMLKVLAKELGVSIIAISQLARSPETRQDHRPILSDLRESGSIEQDADIVLFLYRDEYYNPEQSRPGIAECIVAKNRHGETATIELSWEGQFTRFVGLDKIHEQN